MSAKSPLTCKTQSYVRLRAAVGVQPGKGLRGISHPFFPRTLPHSARGRLSHKKSVQRTASKLALARMAQQAVHLHKTPTVMAARFPPGRWEKESFFPVSLAAV